MNKLRFFNHYADIRQTKNRLPHWQQEGAVYFITFRLADAVPMRLLKRSGSLWQRDYFDRLARDEKHFANCVRYIRRNPAKANLSAHEFLLWESETARGIC